MDCTTFQESEIDALYGELDARASAAMAEHAATCPSCAARWSRLQGTRSLVLSVVEPVATDFESRIMAAVDAGLARRSAGPPQALAAGPMMAGAAPGYGAPGPQPIPLRPMSPQAPAPEQGAKIFQFMSRPVFAAAAAVVLVLGAAFLFSRSKSAPMDATASAPAATALTPVPMVGAAAPAVADESTGMAAASAVALNDPAPPPAATAVPQAAPATPPAVVAMAEPATAAAPPPSKPSHAAGGAAGPSSNALNAAKQLYAQGRYAEALPKFEALKSTYPEADLYAARCIAKTRGCTAAAGRYDQVAQASSGTDVGNRATLEGARCYQANGQLAEARKRYTVAKDEDGVANEAQQALDSLDHNGAGTPGAGARAAPKSARPAPAPASPNNADNVVK